MRPLHGRFRAPLLPSATSGKNPRNSCSTNPATREASLAAHHNGTRTPPSPHTHVQAPSSPFPARPLLVQHCRSYGMGCLTSHRVRLVTSTGRGGILRWCGVIGKTQALRGRSCSAVQCMLSEVGSRDVAMFPSLSCYSTHAPIGLHRSIGHVVHVSAHVDIRCRVSMACARKSSR